MEEIEQFVLALHSSSDGRRRKAAEALRLHGEPGGQLSVERLIDILLHDTIPIRKAAAMILRDWREYVPLDSLFLIMRDAPKEVRSAVVWTLGDVGAYASPERLLPHLTDPDPMMRAALLLALGTRAPVASVLEALFAPDENLRDVAVSLVDLLWEQIPVEPLISKLQDRDVHIRFLAARALGRLGERIPREPLLEALQDAEDMVRREALSALVKLGEQVPKAVLTPLLDDPDQYIHYTTLHALGCMGDEKALSLIIESLHVDHEWERENAVARLQTYGQMQKIAGQLPIEELLHLLKDEWWPVWHMTAEVIATLGEKAPFSELLALVVHPLPQARHAALYTLALLGEQIPLSQQIPIEPLLSALEAEDVWTRRKAANVLEYFEPPVPTDRLLPLLGEDETDIALIVAKRGRQEGIDALVGNVRTMFDGRAVLALGELGERAPLEPLLDALSASDRPAISWVAEALYKTHPEILPSLVSELLETLRTGRVGPLLEPLRHILLLQSLLALGSREPAVLRCFEEALDAAHWEVRMWGAIGFSAMTPKEGEPVLEKLRRLTDDPESASVRQFARRALDHLELPGYPFQMLVGVGSHTGKRKAYNEDSIAAVSCSGRSTPTRSPAGLFVVADGVGGYCNGQEASCNAIQAILDVLWPVVGKRDVLQPEVWTGFLVEAVQEANEVVKQQELEIKGRVEACLRVDVGISATLTAVLLIGSTAYIANVGDCRTYLYRAEAGLKKITRDHLWVARWIEDGTLPLEAVYTHMKRNILYRALPTDPQVEADLFTIPLQSDDVILLCSPGLWRAVRDSRIEKIIRSAPSDPSYVASVLIQTALDEGSRNDISVIVVSLGEGESQTSVSGVQFFAMPEDIHLPQA